MEDLMLYSTQSLAPQESTPYHINYIEDYSSTWCKSFDHLTDDERGIEAFRKYLHDENQDSYLMFWLAVKGFKKKEPNDPKKYDLAKVIYRAFIKKNCDQSVKLSNITVQEITSLIERKVVDGIFDQAQSEVESLLRFTFYPQFIQWQTQSGGSAAGEGAVPAGLAAVQEESSQHSHNCSHYHNLDSLSSFLAPSSAIRCSSRRVSAPASSANNDSDFASLSSDQTTDHDLEGSSSGSHAHHHGGGGRRSVKSQGKSRSPHSLLANQSKSQAAAAAAAQLSIFNATHHSHRKAKTEQRAPPEQPSPAKFAELLISKLEKLQLEQQQSSQQRKDETSSEKLHSRLECLKQQLGNEAAGGTSSQDEDPNLIIDSHVSRVFCDKSQDTPSSCHSPTPICVECGSVQNPQTAVAAAVARGGHTLPARISHVRGTSSNRNRHATRLETSSNISVSSGVDSGCFDVSSQFSTDSRESECATTVGNSAVLSWIHSSMPEEGSGGRSSGRTRRSAASAGGGGGGPSGCSNGGARWASMSPHRNMSHALNHAFLTHQRKSRSNSAERAFNGVKLAVYKPDLPKATTSDSIFDLESDPLNSDCIRKPRLAPGSDGCDIQPPDMPYGRKSSWYKSQKVEKRSSACAIMDGQYTNTLPADFPESSYLDSPLEGSLRCNPASHTVVAYFLCGETIPYRTTVPSKQLTLAQFKTLLTKKGNFRYFFKMRSDDIELGGIVHEEITNDDDILPFFDGKIIGKIEKQT